MYKYNEELDILLKNFDADIVMFATCLEDYVESIIHNLGFSALKLKDQCKMINEKYHLDKCNVNGHKAFQEIIKYCNVILKSYRPEPFSRKQVLEDLDILLRSLEEKKLLVGFPVYKLLFENYEKNRLKLNGITKTVDTVEENGISFSSDVSTVESQVNQEIIGSVPDYISSDDEYYSGTSIDFNSENPLEEFLKVESYLGDYEKKLTEDEIKMYASGGDISSSNAENNNNIVIISLKEKIKDFVLCFNDKYKNFYSNKDVVTFFFKECGIKLKKFNSVKCIIYFDDLYIKIKKNTVKICLIDDNRKIKLILKEKYFKYICQLN